tara:strand:+ start:372 stop:914 length:543 start_codon:yes stop_codon:yes gene_type:complete
MKEIHTGFNSLCPFFYFNNNNNNNNQMNIEKITYKIVKDSIKEDNSCTDFILKMMLSYLSDEQRGSIMDEIVNERGHIVFKKRDEIWFDPKDNKYDLKDCYENDMMKDALYMNEHGHIRGIIIDDTNYQDGCNPYATEYKIKVQFAMRRNGAKVHIDTDKEHKEVRVKRSNIMGLWKSLE